jgi:hypothetical protein
VYFVDLGEVRVDAPLADLVADDGDGAFGDEVAVVGQRLGGAGVDAGFQAVAPGVDAGLGRAVPLVFGELGPAGGGGEEDARLGGFVVVDPFREPGAVLGAAGLVAAGHEDEGRVVAVGAEDAVGLGVEPRVDGLAGAEFGGVVGPRGGLDMEIETEFVGGDEGGLGRAPRVEAKEIQAVGFDDAEDAFPFGDVGGRVAGARVVGAVERAAEKGFLTVDEELRALRGDLAEAEGSGKRFGGDGGGGGGGGEVRFDGVEMRRKFAPELWRGREFYGDLGGEGLRG